MKRVRLPVVCLALLASAGLVGAEDAKPKRRGSAPKLAEETTAGEPAGISFAAQIAPVLVEHCLGCHGSKRASAGLSMANFAALSAGGQTGEPLDAEKPEESLLIQKLNGTAADGQRMPLRRAALPEETIALISRWMAAGASYDGADPQTPLEQLVNSTLAKTLSAEALAERRRNNARRRFQLALPDKTPHEAASAQFVVLGDASEESLQQFAERLESLWPKVAKLLGEIERNGPVDGPAAMIALQGSIDFGEFVRMVLKLEPQRGQAVVWQYDSLDAYAAVTVPEDAAAARLHAAEAMAGLYLATQAPGPEWLIRGVARAVAARIEPKGASVRAWEQQAASTLASRPKAEAIAAGQLSLVDAEAVGYIVGKALLRSPKKLAGLWQRLAAGEALTEALPAATGVRLEQILDQANGTGRGKRGQ